MIFILVLEQVSSKPSKTFILNIGRSGEGAEKGRRRGGEGVEKEQRRGEKGRRRGKERAKKEVEKGRRRM